MGLSVDSAAYLPPPLGLTHTSRMHDKLLALRLFVRVAHTGSFSAAARELDLSQPSVSRIIAALEEDVGAALVTRTTRAVTLTDAGNDYLTRVEAILSSLEEADHTARGSRELRGSLRVAMPASFGVREIIPLMPSFLARHPSLNAKTAPADQQYHSVVIISLVVITPAAGVPNVSDRPRAAGRFSQLSATKRTLEWSSTPRSPRHHRLCKTDYGIAFW